MQPKCPGSLTCPAAAHDPHAFGSKSWQKASSPLTVFRAAAGVAAGAVDGAGAGIGLSPSSRLSPHASGQLRNKFNASFWQAPSAALAAQSPSVSAGLSLQILHATGQSRIMLSALLPSQ